jgi:D-alanyl-lipoteichoic acid acyltransferase DltB (MBOAT superfamily)
MTLTEYIKKRNGVPIGNSNSLRNNLYRSLGAKNFSAFWNYWNPVFGYYLGRFVFKPLKKIFPVGIALLFTFIFCGLIHDAVTTIFRGKTSFFFTIWFLLMGLAVLITKFYKHNFSKKIWISRVLINVCIISICFLLTYYTTRFLIVR